MIHKRQTATLKRLRWPFLAILSMSCAAGDTSALLPTLGDIYPQRSRVTVSELCHILLYYKFDKTDIRGISTGQEAFEILTNDEKSRATFGTSPLIKTRHGIRYLVVGEPLSESGAAESHRDQCLATFASIGCPKSMPLFIKGIKYTISDLLAESLANFTLEQREVSWSAVAYSIYLPPQTQWKDKRGERYNLSQIVDVLIKKNLDRESCAGIHILQSLLSLQQADNKWGIFAPETKGKVNAYVLNLISDAKASQRVDGSWPWQWCRYVKRYVSVTARDNLLLTGHLAEIFASLSKESTAEESTYTKAASYLGNVLREKGLQPDESWICPLVHAHKAATALEQRRTR